MIIFHSKASVSRKIEIFTEALRRFEIDDLYVRPDLRGLLKKEDVPMVIIGMNSDPDE